MMPVVLCVLTSAQPEETALPLLPAEAALYPDDLFAKPWDPTETSTRWWALYTRARAEKSLAGHRLTQSQILADLAKRGYHDGESMVKLALAHESRWREGHLLSFRYDPAPEQGLSPAGALPHLREPGCSQLRKSAATHCRCDMPAAKCGISIAPKVGAIDVCVQR